MQQRTPPDAKPKKKNLVLRRAIAVVILGAVVGSLVAALTFVKAAPVAIAACLVLVLAAGLALLIVRAAPSDANRRADDFLRFAALPYQRLIYPGNYSNTPKELVPAVIRHRVRPIADLVSMRKIASGVALRLIGLFAIGFLFCSGAVHLYVVASGAAMSYPETALFVADSMLRGALFDLFEAYDIPSLAPPTSDMMFRHMDFATRTVTSVAVIGGLAPAFQLWAHRGQYRRAMKNLGGKFDFFRRLENLAHGWTLSISPSVGDGAAAREMFDAIVLPYLWEHDGPRVEGSYRDYVARTEAASRESGHNWFLGLDAHYLENWKIDPPPDKA